MPLVSTSEDTGVAEIAELDRRLAEGDQSEFVLCSAGHAALDLAEPSWAIECLKRLDPCSTAAADLRSRLESSDWAGQLPEAPTGLSADPAEVVARAFLETAAPGHVLARVLRYGWRGLAVLSALVLSTLLQPEWQDIVTTMIVLANVVVLVAEGPSLREAAWRRPGNPPQPSSEFPDLPDRSQWAISLATLTCLVAPLVLGFVAGATWSLLLAFPVAALSATLLVGVPLHGVGTGFPFSVPPQTKEAGAIAFIALLVCAVTLIAALFAWLDLFAEIPALLVFDAAWCFHHRASGLLARRILARISAERAREAPLPRFPRLDPQNGTPTRPQPLALVH